MIDNNLATEIRNRLEAIVHPESNLFDHLKDFNKSDFINQVNQLKRELIECIRGFEKDYNDLNTNTAFNLGLRPMSKGTLKEKKKVFKRIGESMPTKDQLEYDQKGKVETVKNEIKSNIYLCEQRVKLLSDLLSFVQDMSTGNQKADPNGLANNWQRAMYIYYTRGKRPENARSDINNKINKWINYKGGHATSDRTVRNVIKNMDVVIPLLNPLKDNHSAAMKDREELKAKLPD